MNLHERVQDSNTELKVLIQEVVQQQAIMNDERLNQITANMDRLAADLMNKKLNDEMREETNQILMVYMDRLTLNIERLMHEWENR